VSKCSAQYLLYFQAVPAQIIARFWYSHSPSNDWCIDIDTFVNCNWVATWWQ